MDSTDSFKPKEFWPFNFEIFLEWGYADIIFNQPPKGLGDLDFFARHEAAGISFFFSLFFPPFNFFESKTLNHTLYLPAKKGNAPIQWKATLQAPRLTH